jgi:hypothetical protein
VLATSRRSRVGDRDSEEDFVGQLLRASATPPPQWILIQSVTIDSRIIGQAADFQRCQVGRATAAPTSCRSAGSGMCIAR